MNNALATSSAAPSSALTLFTYQGNQVRTILDERTGEPWWVAKDVCDVLGIAWRGEETLLRIPAGWKGVQNYRTPGGEQTMIIISEPALYKLAFRSRKSEADAFTNWIASEVIPAIRKTGSYSAAPTSPATLGLPDFTDPAAAAVAWAEQFSARKALAASNAALVEKVEELEDDLKITGAACDELDAALVEAAPKVEFYDTVAASDRLISVEVVAKELGIPGLGRNKLFQVLRQIGWVQKGKTLPYQKTVDAGFMAVRKIRTFDGMVYDRGCLSGSLESEIMGKMDGYIT